MPAFPVLTRRHIFENQLLLFSANLEALPVGGFCRRALGFCPLFTTCGFWIVRGFVL